MKKQIDSVKYYFYLAYFMLREIIYFKYNYNMYREMKYFDKSFLKYIYWITQNKADCKLAGISLKFRTLNEEEKNEIEKVKRALSEFLK